MVSENISHAIDLEKSRKPPSRLTYLGNVSRPYGITEEDTWSMDKYMAGALANGLRMLVAYGNAVRDEAQYERIAAKLEFYSTDDSQVLHSNIDWSNDAPDDLLDWVNAEDRSPWPGMNEYSEKSAQIEYWQRVYMDEALEWLKVHWGELWD